MFFPDDASRKNGRGHVGVNARHQKPQDVDDKQEEQEYPRISGRKSTQTQIYEGVDDDSGSRKKKKAKTRKGSSQNMLFFYSDNFR